METVAETTINHNLLLSAYITDVYCVQPQNPIY